MSARAADPRLRSGSIVPEARLRHDAGAPIGGSPCSPALRAEASISPNRPRILVSAIVAEVVSEFGVGRTELLSPCRDRRVFGARAAVAWLARRGGRTYPEIGRRMNRDQTSILHAVRRADELLQTDPEFRARVEAIDRRLGCKPVLSSQDQEIHMTTRTGTCVDCGEPFLAGCGPRKRCYTCADKHEQARQREIGRRRAEKRRAAKESDRSRGCSSASASGPCAGAPLSGGSQSLPDRKQPQTAPSAADRQLAGAGARRPGRKAAHAERARREPEQRA